MQLTDLQDCELALIFKNLSVFDNDLETVANVCKRFRQNIRPSCVVLTKEQEARNISTISQNIYWPHVQRLIMRPEFLVNLPFDDGENFFNKIRPNLEDLVLDFGLEPPVYSRTVLTRLLQQNCNLLYMSCQVKCFEMKSHGIMPELKEANLNVCVGPNDSFEFEDNIYYPKIESFSFGHL
jgi:hypothetical protein